MIDLISGNEMGSKSCEHTVMELNNRITLTKELKYFYIFCCMTSYLRRLILGVQLLLAIHDQLVWYESTPFKTFFRIIFKL